MKMRIRFIFYLHVKSIVHSIFGIMLISTVFTRKMEHFNSEFPSILRDLQ